MIIRYFLVTVVLILVLAITNSTSALSKIALLSTKKCGFQEDVSLSVNFNFPVESFRGAKAKFDEKLKQVEDYAKAQKIDKFELQSMNYNINSQSGYNGMPDTFQFSGSMSYKLDSFESGVKLGEFLSKQKFQVNLSANSYKNGSCSQ